MTISFKVSDKTKEEMIKHFEDLKREKTPAYAIFQADEEDGWSFDFTVNKSLNLWSRFVVFLHPRIILI